MPGLPQRPGRERKEPPARARAPQRLPSPQPQRGRRTTSDAKRIKELEREVARKDKALAETAALLVLKKKMSLLLGDEADDTDPRSDK